MGRDLSDAEDKSKVPRGELIICRGQRKIYYIQRIEAWYQGEHE
jgi:hypothetical protein